MTGGDLRRAAELLEQGDREGARGLLADTLAALDRPEPRPVPPLPADFRAALEQLRAEARDALAGGSWWAGVRLGELLGALALLELAPDPRDVSGLGELARRLAAEFPELARSRWGEALEALRFPLPALTPPPLSAEAEALRAELLGTLGDLEGNAEAGRLRVLPLYLGSLRRRGPVLRELLSGLPSSAFPHADAARAAAVSHALASGFRESWPLADGAARLSALTAPEPPHPPRVLALPVWREVSEPDPPVCWRARLEVGAGTFRADMRPPEFPYSAADPLGGPWRAGGPGSGREGPELLPVRFPLALRRADLPYWRGWIPAPAEGGT